MTFGVSKKRCTELESRVRSIVGGEEMASEVMGAAVGGAQGAARIPEDAGEARAGRVLHVVPGGAEGGEAGAEVGDGLRAEVPGGGPGGQRVVEVEHLYVVQREGTFCSMADFKRAFGKYMSYQHRGVKWTFDEKNEAPFEELGYEVVDKNWCKACNQEARGGADRCCAAYSNANRTHAKRIVGMTIVREEAATAEDPLQWRN